MYPSLHRRDLLVASLASLAVFPMPHARAAVRPLLVTRRTLDINGKAASVFAIRQSDGSAGLTLDPGQRFQIDVVNQADEATILHWHGQTPPPDQDGVVESGGALIGAGATLSYDFTPRPGTHWMHSHHGLQEQKLMAAPLIVRSTEDLRRDAQEVVVLLHDFTFREPAELLAGLTGGGMQHGAGQHAGHAMPMAVPDLNDVAYDAYLANDRTLADPLVVRTERRGRVHLRLINGATSTAFWIDLGALTATVLAVDGNAVQPVIASRFPLAQGQRIDLMIAMPEAGGAVPILAQREGDRVRTGIILAPPSAPIARVAEEASSIAGAIDLSLEQRLVAVSPLAANARTVTHRIGLTGTMMPYLWGIDDRSWAAREPLRVRKGERVVIEMTNRSAMAHPMHLHGHHFQVVALGGKPVSGAVRDTVLVPIGGAVTVALDADNPGAWLLHCHNLLHMATGMMTELIYETG
jgi:FtsP/CotA-like multicopper oxidase with cupredoxin domain